MARKSPNNSCLGLLIGVAAAGLLTALPVQAGVIEAVNWARLQGCAGPAREALREDARLQVAADRMAAGESLRASLSGAGYLASRSATVHVSGEITDAMLQELFVKRDCEALTDASMTEMGVQRRGREVWIVVATPALLPSAADAALIRRQILDLVNAARATGHRCGNKSFPSAPPLELNADLTQAALAHSQEMATFNEFQHGGQDGSSLSARVARTGYGAFSEVGENIAAGVMNSAEVMRGWLNSPPHCENIMEASFKEIGIAYAVTRRGDDLVFWTQDFAAPVAVAR
jgi:uncharacterized protein YkwD